MRLLVVYAAQVAFIVAGFAAVTSVFVSINSDAITSNVAQLLSATGTVATERAQAPLDKFATTALSWADQLLANPALQCDNPQGAEWNPENVSVSSNPSYVLLPTLRMSQGKELKLGVHRNNQVALYVYETFQVSDNASQIIDCGTGRTKYENGFSFFTPSLHRGGHTTSPDSVSCITNLSVTSEGRMKPQVIDPGWYCYVNHDFNEEPQDYQLAARDMIRNDSATGKWIIFTTFFSRVLQTTVPVMTFAVPLNFSTPDPVTGAYHCTNAAMMDLSGEYLTNLFQSQQTAGVELALFWDLEESLVSWTLTTPSYDPVTGDLLAAGATGTLFDDAVTAFHDAGWCSGSAQLSGCVSPSDGSSVSSSRYVFALRRVVHINARFTIVISGDRDTFFGPGERARAVGIGVSVAVCVVCLATSVMLWLTTVRPLRRLISNMELASTFSSDVDAEGDSCITEVNEANVAFLSMHEQLQMAKPFMPQHLLEQFEDARLPPANDSNLYSSGVNDDDMHTVYSGRRSQRSASSLQAGVTGFENRVAAVLVVNISGFDVLVRGSSTLSLQSYYAKFIDAVIHVTKSHRGVLDSAQGDHVIVSFNTTLRCATPAAKAINAAFALRKALTLLPIGWQRITCGVSVGNVQCGTLGSHEVKSHATLGTVVRQAVGLQRVARALDDQRREAAAATAGVGNDVSVAPGWCVGTARVVQDCATFAHFRYEAVASLPPSGRTTVIASIFPPKDDPPTQHRPSARVAVEGMHHEWLYDVGASSNYNPHLEHNAAVLMRFSNNDITNFASNTAQESFGHMGKTLFAAVAAVSIPNLWDL